MILTKTLLNPFKSLKYLEEYFLNLSQFQKDFKMKKEIQFITGVAIVKGIQAVFFYVAPLSFWWRILLVDYAIYFGMPVIMNLAYIPVPTLIVLYLRMLYYDNNNIVIKEVVVEQNNRYFLYKSVYNKKVSNFVRKLALIALLANQPMIIAVGKILF